MISLKEFQKLAKTNSRIPLQEEVPNDLLTPVALYQCFADEKYSFLLESVEGGEKWGRYSFIGLYPSLIFRSFGSRVEIEEGKRKKSFSSTDPLQELKKIISQSPFVTVPGLPRFSGGAVGMVSYDMVRFFEKIRGKNSDKKKEGVNVPDLYFIVPKILIVTDNPGHCLKIIYTAHITSSAQSSKSEVEKEYEAGKKLINRIKKQIFSFKSKAPKISTKQKKIKWKASLSEKQHSQALAKIREYIAAGDIFQAVFSIRFQAAIKINSFSLYRALRSINPSPYLFHLKFPDMSLVGASPETMVHMEEREITLRPIAGTRPRGKNEMEDKSLEQDLLHDQKELAEHIMLVDLGRNDLGRIAKPGTVHVDEMMSVERYSHVMHLVSSVRAELAEGRDAFDVLRSTFPAGTLSGAPKIRAMELIEELEPVRRGFYGGCVGYFDFSGNMDMAITIRSALVEKNQVTVQAGGGIVADSNPQKEYQEVINKSKAVMKAVEEVL